MTLTASDSILNLTQSSPVSNFRVHIIIAACATPQRKVLVTALHYFREAVTSAAGVVVYC